MISDSIRLTFVEDEDRWSATARVVPDLLRALAILLDTTVSRSAVDQEDLNPYWISEKRPHFFRWSTVLLFTSFSKTLLTTEKKTNRAVDL